MCNAADRASGFHPRTGLRRKYCAISCCNLPYRIGGSCYIGKYTAGIFQIECIPVQCNARWSCTFFCCCFRRQPEILECHIGWKAYISIPGQCTQLMSFRTLIIEFQTCRFGRNGKYSINRHRVIQHLDLILIFRIIDAVDSSCYLLPVCISSDRLIFFDSYLCNYKQCFRNLKLSAILPQHKFIIFSCSIRVSFIPKYCCDIEHLQWESTGHAGVKCHLLKQCICRLVRFMDLHGTAALFICLYRCSIDRQCIT